MKKARTARKKEGFTGFIGMEEEDVVGDVVLLFRVVLQA